MSKMVQIIVFSSIMVLLLTGYSHACGSELKIINAKPLIYQKLKLNLGFVGASNYEDYRQIRDDDWEFVSYPEPSQNRGFFDILAESMIRDALVDLYNLNEVIDFLHGYFMLHGIILDEYEICLILAGADEYGMALPDIPDDLRDELREQFGDIVDNPFKVVDQAEAAWETGVAMNIKSQDFADLSYELDYLYGDIWF